MYYSCRYSNHGNVHLAAFALQTFDSNVNYTSRLAKLAKQKDFCLVPERRIAFSTSFIKLRLCSLFPAATYR